MMMTATSKITIPLSERPPVSVSDQDWPIIAAAHRHEGMVECQANTEWAIQVREHADGRRVVYGSMIAGGGGQYVGFRPIHVGFVVEAKDGTADSAATVRAIRRVGGLLDDSQLLAAECISDLPAEDL